MSRVLALAFALALVAPRLALAMVPAPPDLPPGLSDSSEPGSVLIFPFFMTGTVPVFAGTAGAFNAAKTVIEVGAVCPAALAEVGCVEQNANVHFHWVCPGVVDGDNPSVCNQTDFNVKVSFGTINAGKVSFNPGDGTKHITGPGQSDYNGSTIVPIAPCPHGYLIGYVEDTIGRPVKFDGLVGDATVRWSPDSLSSYQALAIQADPATPNWEQSNDRTGAAVLALGPGGSLIFDGGPKHYQMTTGQLQGDVAFNSDLTPPFHDDSIIFLTLDVNSGLNNFPTAVQLSFFNFHEAQVSSEFTFVCWGKASLAMLSPDLTVEEFGSQRQNGQPGKRHDRGLFQSGQAINVSTRQFVTLLGLTQTAEGPVGGAPTIMYLRKPGNNSQPIPTQFLPFE